MEIEPLMEEAVRDYIRLEKENPDHELLRYISLINGRLLVKPEYRDEFEHNFTPTDQDEFSSFKGIELLREYSKALKEALG
jgi:hypothetical protein